MKRGFFAVGLVLLLAPKVAGAFGEEMSLDVLQALDQLDGSQKMCGEDYPSSYRILTAGSAIAVDHDPVRLNIKLDNAGRIVSTWCG